MTQLDKHTSPLQHYILGCLIILVANKLGFDASGGEDQYLSFARQYVNPEWIPNSYSITEFAGSRIVFQWIVGPIMEVVSFDWAVFSFRLINFSFYALVVGTLFQTLRLNLLLSLCFFHLFVMSEQNLIGGEWIFKTFEPKSVAYIFVFAALRAFHLSKYTWVCIFLVFSCYFHVLVGGWTLMVLGAVMLLNGKWKKIIKPGIIFVLLLLPFAFYLIPGYFLIEVPESDPTVNWIYAYYRLPNHLGIWKNTEYFLNGNARDSVITFILLIITFFWRHHIPKGWKWMNQTVQVIFSVNLIFVGIAAMDHFFFDNSGGFGIKYYPFRTNSIGMFLVMLIGFQLAYNWLANKVWKKKLYAGVVTLVFALLVAQTVNNVQRSERYYSEAPDYKAMVKYVRENTPKTAVFYLREPYFGWPIYYSFNRRAERENFFVPKFIFAQADKTLSWFERLKHYQRARYKISRVVGLQEKYGVTHMMSTTEWEEPFLEQVHQTGAYRLYKIVPVD